jgi:serine/threonine protein kinase
LIHRDLKSLNVLLTKNGRAKVADFGLSRFNKNLRARASVSGAGGREGDDTDGIDFEELMTGLRGSPLWMAPELETRRSADAASYGFPVDVYSYGIVLFEIISTRWPWDEVQAPVSITVLSLVGSGKRPPLRKEEEKAAINGGCGFLPALMRQCWAHLPSERPTFGQVIQLIDEHLPQASIHRSRSVDPGGLLLPRPEPEGPTGEPNRRTRLSFDSIGMPGHQKTTLKSRFLSKW